MFFLYNFLLRFIIKQMFTKLHLFVKLLKIFKKASSLLQVSSKRTKNFICSCFLYSFFFVLRIASMITCSNASLKRDSLKSFSLHMFFSHLFNLCLLLLQCILAPFFYSLGIKNAPIDHDYRCLATHL